LHFSCMVFGLNVEKKLQPFHEYECTGIKDEYVIEVDITEEVRSEFEAYDSSGHSFRDYLQYTYGEIEEVPVGKKPNIREYTWAEVDENNEIVAVKKLTNPNSQWDWWVTGGRFAGHLLLKNGDRVNSACARDVDITKIISEASDLAATEWDEVHEVLGDDNTWETWKDVSARISDWGERREAYNGQEPVKKIRRISQFLIVDQFLLSRDEYIEFHARRAFPTFAIVDVHGEWHSGDWSGDEQDRENWINFFWMMWNELDPYTVITVVDCHI